MPEQNRVHLGCDTGEASGGPERENEMRLLEHVTAVSIACGGHAGDPESMQQAIGAACMKGCLIGAHPSYPDRAGFGRRTIEIDRQSLGRALHQQLTEFATIAASCGARVSFVKAHGALYHAVALDREFARWYWACCASVFPSACFVVPYGSAAHADMATEGVSVLVEGFSDRVYTQDGTLLPRTAPGACISIPDQAADQAELLVTKHGCDLLCVHSDTPNALAVAQAVRARLRDMGVLPELP